MHDGGGVCWRRQSHALVDKRAVDSMVGVDVLEVVVERMVVLGVDVTMIL